LKVNRPELERKRKKKVRFSRMSVSGGIVNAFEAVKLAGEMTKLQK